MSVGIKGPGGGRKIPVNPWEGSTTITPSAEDKIIPAYTDKELTVEGDKDLVGENILSSKNIFGVQGLIPPKAAETITPGTTDKTIASGQYILESQTIKGDTDLIAENIRKSKNIFGVIGTFVGTDLSKTGYKVAVDIITPATNYNLSGGGKYISHSLGITPKIAIIIAEKNASRSPYRGIFNIFSVPGRYGNGENTDSDPRVLFTESGNMHSAVGFNTIHDSSKVNFTVLPNQGQYYLYAGVTYTVITLG